jgi:CheY-like chemotaxis protein
MRKIDTLCIVDDDDIFQYITQKVVEKTELVKTIKVFSNGLEAINFIDSALSNHDVLPDVILLDLNMPILDGWGFLEEYIIRKPRIGKIITIYIVSSSIDPVDIERAKTISEVTDFVVKPLTQDKLIELVNNL